jgi:hypothetical protein
MIQGITLRPRKPIVAGKEAVQEGVDFELSRSARHLIAQDGDPGKPQITRCTTRHPALALLEAYEN